MKRRRLNKIAYRLTIGFIKILVEIEDLPDEQFCTFWGVLYFISLILDVLKL